MTTQLETELELPANDAEEIQKLRRVKESLHQTAQQRKARIDELEAQVATLTTQLEAANKKVHEATYGLPLRAMANDISVVPSLFEREYLSRFGLIDQDGTLFVTKAGESSPLLDANEQPIAFTSNALNKLLESDAVNSTDREMFKAILIGSKASGSGASGAGRGGSAQSQPAKKIVQEPLVNSFGLK